MAVIGMLLIYMLEIYKWIVIVSVVVSWLIAFEVINPASAQARNLLDLLRRVTEPVFRPLRKYIPAIGGIDITPLIVIFGILLAEMIVRQVFFGPIVVY